MVLNVDTLDLTSCGGHHLPINHLFHNGLHLYIFTEVCLDTAIMKRKKTTIILTKRGVLTCFRSVQQVQKTFFMNVNGVFNE